MDILPWYLFQSSEAPMRSVFTNNFQDLLFLSPLPVHDVHQGQGMLSLCFIFSFSLATFKQGNNCTGPCKALEKPTCPEKLIEISTECKKCNYVTVLCHSFAVIL